MVGPSALQNLRLASKSFFKAARDAGVALKPKKTIWPYQLLQLCASFPRATSLDLRRSVQLTGQSLAHLKPLAPSLKRLHLEGCAWLDLPGALHITALTGLEALFLDGSYHFLYIPAGFTSLTSLETLEISFCECLKSFSDFDIGKLTSLHTLSLQGTYLKTLPEGISRLANLRILSLGYCHQLDELPSGLSRFTGLRSLTLRRACDNLRALPDMISALVSLETLECTYCTALEALPASIGRLHSLHSLDLSGCRALAALPDGISLLSDLKNLNLSNCTSLERLPNGMGQLAALESLCLRDCSALVSLPAGFSGLIALRILGLGRCEALEFLPGAPRIFSALSSLAVLNITGCSPGQARYICLAFSSTTPYILRYAQSSNPHSTSFVCNLPALQWISVHFCLFHQIW